MTAAASASARHGDDFQVISAKGRNGMQLIVFSPLNISRKAVGTVKGGNWDNHPVKLKDSFRHPSSNMLL